MLLPTVLYILHAGLNLEPHFHRNAVIVVVVLGELLRLPEIRLPAIIM